MWHLRVNAIIMEVLGDGRRARGPGGAGHAVFSAVRTCLACCTDLPILLQHHGHSRTVLGLLSSPCRLVVRDPSDKPSEYRCFSPHELDGRQYQLVVVRNRKRSGPLSEREVHARLGEPRTAASWTATGWEYDPSCGMRFE